MEVFLAAAGGTWFAIFALFIFVAGIVSAEYDSFFGGTATFIVGLLGADIIFGYSVIAAIISNPLIILLALALYVFVGSVYTGFWKWPDYIRSVSDLIDAKFNIWLNKDKQNHSFDEFLESVEYSPFSAANNKERLAAWVLMWPFSLFWELLRKPAIWLFNTSYAMLGDMFESIGKRTAKAVYNKGNK